MRGESAFWEKGIYRLTNAGLLTGVALFGGERFLGIGSMSAPLVMEAILVLGLLFGINFLPIRGKFVCLCGAASGVGVALSAAGVQTSLLFLRGYFPWLMGNGGGYEAWADGYGFLQTAIIVALCYLLQIVFEKLPQMKLLSAVFLLAGVVFCLLKKRDVPHWGMAFGICFIATVYAEWTEGHWKKVRSGSRKAYMLRIMPFLAVYLLLMGCMPAPETPFEWRWVKNIYHQIQETLTVCSQRIRWGDREGFNMAFSGFSEEADLGGNLEEKGEAVMRVQLLNAVPVNVYLTGMVYDTFDGRQWQQNYLGDPKGVFLDAAETLGAVRAFDQQYQKDYLHNIKMRICYQDFNSGYVFAPLKTWEIKSVGKELVYTCEGGSLRLERSQGYGTTYELQYYQMNGGQEAFYRFLEMCSGGSWDLPEEAIYVDQAVWEDMQEFDMEDAAAHRQEIYENYLKEVRLSSETADYLARITEKAETDVEKLRAIERELSSFVYTRMPGELPQWVTDESDFLDYFLLGSRQGYCTYFATAFVLLARAEGIPARYVQGFCVPGQNTEETCVYSNMAHAWPEAYILGAGWIPFEPTPGYSEVRFTPWELQRPEAEEAGTDEETGSYEVAGEEESRRAEDEFGRDETLESVPEEEGRTGHFLKLLGYMVPVALTGYALLLLFDNVWSRHRYRRMCAEEKFKLEVFRNLRLLKLLGMVRGKAETLQELGERCKLRTDLGTVTYIEDYEGVVYGGRSVSEEMIEGAIGERQALQEKLKREKRWVYMRWRAQSYLIRHALY